MTAFGAIEEAVRAMKEGAPDFLTKPVDTEHLRLLLERAVEQRRLQTEYVLLKEDYQRPAACRAWSAKPPPPGGDRLACSAPRPPTRPCC